MIDLYYTISVRVPNVNVLVGQCDLHCMAERLFT